MQKNKKIDSGRHSKHNRAQYSSDNLALIVHCSEVVCCRRGGS